MQKMVPGATAQDGPEGAQTPARRPAKPWTARRVALRCEAPYAAWLGQLAQHCGLSASQTIAVAVAKLADSHGFHAPPPARNRRNPVAHLHPRAALAAFHHVDGPAEQGGSGG